MRNNLLFAVGLWLFMSINANATEIVPITGNWYFFDVDEVISQSGGTEWIDAQVDESFGYMGDGSALTFSFSLTSSAFLNLVDAGLAGDVFTLVVNGVEHTSSAVAANSTTFAGADFDAAWSMPEFSRLSLLLAPGVYQVTGFLNQSATDEYGSPYLATAGGLQIVDVDEPGLFVLFGLGVFLLLCCRMKRNAVTLFDKGVLV